MIWRKRKLLFWVTWLTIRLWQQPKLTAFENFTVATHVNQLRSFLEVCFWYSHFVDNYTEIVTPLTELKKMLPMGTYKEQRAFEIM